MKGEWKTGGRLLAVLIATALIGFAETSASQNENGQQPRMASPGAINYVEGPATLDGQALTAAYVGSAVAKPNQAIATTNGYVEVLLTPGAFLRIGHDGEVRLRSASLAGATVQMNRGAALIEVADLVEGSTLAVDLDGTSTALVKKGLYSFDAGEHSVRVLDGKAEVRNATGETTLKKCDQVLLASDKPLKKCDFETKEAKQEPLYVWSKVRGEQQAEANRNSADSLAASGAWYGPGWYWNPYWSGYAYMPGSGFLYSPFGWGFYGYAYPRIWGGLGYRYYYVPRYYGNGFRGHSWGHHGGHAGRGGHR